MEETLKYFSIVKLRIIGFYIKTIFFEHKMINVNVK